MKTMLQIDFEWLQFWQQFKYLIEVFLLTMLQDIIFLVGQLNVPMVPLNYSNIDSIYSDVMPIETFWNWYTKDDEETRPFFEKYINVEQGINLGRSQNVDLA